MEQTLTPIGQWPEARSLPRDLRCPICGDTLRVDPGWVSPHWLCPRGHGYSNVSVLIAELRARGWLGDEAIEVEPGWSRSDAVWRAVS